MGVNIRKFLIVEEDSERASLFKSFFGKGNQIADIVSTGVEALDYIEKGKYNAILTKSNLPRLNCKQLVACVRVGNHNQRTPIFVVTIPEDQDALGIIADFKIVKLIDQNTTIEQIYKRVLKEITPKVDPAIAYTPKTISLFQNAGNEILEFYSKGKVTTGDPFVRREPEGIGFVSGSVSVYSRQIYGSIHISCKEEMIVGLANELFGLPKDEIDPLEFVDLAGELANQIGGTVKTSYYDEDIFLNLGLPQIILGQNHILPKNFTSPRIAIPYASKLGECQLEFSILDPRLLIPPRDEATAEIFIYKTDAMKSA